VVASVVIGLSQPRDLVLCQSGSGHSAIEDLRAGCCRAPGGEASCAQGPGASDPRDIDGKQGTDGDDCTDVLVEAPTRLPLGKRVSAQQAPALLLASMEGPSPLQTGRLSRRRGAALPEAAHALAPSSVLRI
jgi:hypothetical protein